MIDPVPIFLRVHTEVLKRPKGRRASKTLDSGGDGATCTKTPGLKWPEYALVIDCETTTDECQAPTFGAYRFCRAEANGLYVCIEEGFFYPDNVPEANPALSVLRRYCNTHQAETEKGYPDRLRLLSRSEFMERVFWRAAGRAGALVVGLNVPFDLSRLAVDCREARRQDEGWSLVMFLDKDPKTGSVRENPLRPRIKITPKDSKAAFIRFAGVGIRSKKTGRRLIGYTPGRFLDLRTFGWALRNQSLGLQGWCEVYGIPGKLSHEPSGRVSLAEMDYCRQDVRATVSLLNAMRAEFDRHPIELHPDRAYSPASIAKAYLEEMGVTRPLQKFAVPSEVLGVAMQAYYGGRAESRIRHTQVPVVHTDFLSEYPTVNTLMGLWSFLTAERLRIDDATEEVRSLLANLTLDQPDFWKRLSFFALIRQTGDVLPVRTTYSGEATNIGVNPLTSEEPIWYAGPDVVAATLLTGRPPEIVRALRLLPEGQQAGLKPVTLRGMVDIDPRKDDFFKALIEARARVKRDEHLPKDEREALSYFLKILANAGSYGLFVEVNPERVGIDAKTGKPARAKLRVFAGERVFETTSEVVERPGPWYFPPFAALITAAGRLLLTLLERTVTDASGTYLLCDTDSMGIIASEHGELVPCVGGRHCLSDGRDAVKALSWADEESVVASFEQLNPYDRTVVCSSILKVENVNFSSDGKQRQLYGYAIAAKRYALFTRTADGGIQVEKASGHGLGFLYPPKPGFDDSADAPIWVVEAWDWILREALGLPAIEPSWFGLPAMMRLAITTPEVLKVLQVRQKGLPYRDRTKPYNFVLSPIIDRLTGGHPVGADPDRFTLIAPFTPDPSRWYGLSYVNVHDGKSYRLARPGRRLPFDAEAQTYGDVVSRYRWHPEAKSLAPDGNPCTSHSAGLLRRSPVTADGFRYIPKETNRRWEQGEDFSLLDPLVLEYHPNETARLVTDPILQRDARRVSIRALARAAGVSDKTVKAARRSQRLRKSTVEKLAKVLKSLPFNSKRSG